MWLYFLFLIWTADSAAAPAIFCVEAIWDGATVSTQVASHINERPLAQGINVSPSGLLPSERLMPTGSSMVGKPADVRDRLIMSFRAECLEILPELLRQLRPWWPSSSTTVPQRQVCGWQNLQPKRKAIAMLKDKLSISVPILEDGIAFSHALASRSWIASNRALSTNEKEELTREVWIRVMLIRSHCFWISKDAVGERLHRSTRFLLNENCWYFLIPYHMETLKSTLVLFHQATVFQKSLL